MANKYLIDRSNEKNEDPEVIVTLPCGYRVKYFIANLSDKEYINRTKRLKQSENKYRSRWKR